METPSGSPTPVRTATSQQRGPRPSAGAKPGTHKNSEKLCDAILDAAEAVVVRQGIANLTLDAVAAQAGMSKGGLLHHFPTKDRLVTGLVTRCAEGWRACYMEAYENTPPGPGRMARALLDHCLSDAECWTDQLRHSSSAVFAALAQNSSLIEPMRAVYSDLHGRIANDGLPPGVGEAVVAAIDGLWLDWVLGLVPVDQALVVRVRIALEQMLERFDVPAPRALAKSAPAARARGAAHSNRVGTHSKKPAKTPAKKQGRPRS